MIERAIKKSLLQGLVSMSGSGPVVSRELIIDIYRSRTKFNLGKVRLKDVFDSYYDLVSDGILTSPDGAGEDVRLAKGKFSPK